MERKQHTIDKERARCGVVLEFDGGKFTIASNTTATWTKAMQAARRKYTPAQLEKDPALDRECTLSAAADALLKTWEGVTDGGTPLAPTFDNKLALLRECPEFREWVFEQSRNLANFAAEADAADATAIKSPA